MTWLPYLKFLHVLSAIIAVGANAMYGILIGRAARDAGALAPTLRTVKFIDDRVANPAYGVLLITGLAQVFVAHLDIAGTFWLAAGLILYVVMAAVALAAYSPTLKRQIAALESAGADSPAYRAATGRGRAIGIVLGVLAILIVFDMVVKPFH